MRTRVIRAVLWSFEGKAEGNLQVQAVRLSLIILLPAFADFHKWWLHSICVHTVTLKSDFIFSMKSVLRSMSDHLKERILYSTMKFDAHAYRIT